MNASAPLHSTVPPVPRYSIAQLAAQERAQFNLELAKLGKLFDRSGARDDEREDFLNALNDFVIERTAQQADFDEGCAAESDRETGRKVFAGLNRLGAVS